MKILLTALFAFVLFDAGTGLPIANLDYPCANRSPDPRYICKEIGPADVFQSSTSLNAVPIAGSLLNGAITISADGKNWVTPTGTTPAAK